jgi:hypothetical protein
MDLAKLEKKFNKPLPLWIRAGNFMSNVFDFFDMMEEFLYLLVMFLLGYRGWFLCTFVRDCQLLL